MWKLVKDVEGNTGLAVIHKSDGTSAKTGDCLWNQFFLHQLQKLFLRQMIKKRNGIPAIR